jgi:cytidine deaminase
MLAFLQSKKRLSEEQLVSHLRNLRKKALIENSHFAVAALIEVKLKPELYAYVGGVNFENREHNRLSTHAEQNAAAAAQALLGEVPFSRVWVMGAPSGLKVGSKAALANKAVMPCGHCRQILLSLALKNFKIYTVTLNGKISPALSLRNLLPKGFSEHDLALKKVVLKKKNKMAAVAIRKDLLEKAPALTRKEILNYLLQLEPHIISPQFQTSAITACLFQLMKPRAYVPGVLVQDVAFLTTDAIFAAAGLAVTLRGGKKLEFIELHLLTRSLKGGYLSGSEIELLGRFAKKTLTLHFYTRTGKYRKVSFSSCI